MNFAAASATSARIVRSRPCTHMEVRLCLSSPWLKIDLYRHPVSPSATSSLILLGHNRTLRAFHFLVLIFWSRDSSLVASRIVPAHFFHLWSSAGPILCAVLLWFVVRSCVGRYFLGTCGSRSSFKVILVPREDQVSAHLFCALHGM